MEKREVTKNPQSDSCYTGERCLDGSLLTCHPTGQRGFLIVSVVITLKALYHCDKNQECHSKGTLCPQKPSASLPSYPVAFLEIKGLLQYVS